MTKKETLKAAAKQWRWMAERIRERKVPVLLEKEPWEDFLCGYAMEEAKRNKEEFLFLNTHCKYCPIQAWAKRADNKFGMQPCLLEGSPYRAYCLLDIEDWEMEAKAADKVAEMIDQELAALEEKEEEE